MILYVMQADSGAVCTRVNHTCNEWAQSGQNSLIAWVDLHRVFFLIGRFCVHEDNLNTCFGKRVCGADAEYMLV